MHDRSHTHKSLQGNQVIDTDNDCSLHSSYCTLPFIASAGFGCVYSLTQASLDCLSTRLRDCQVMDTDNDRRLDFNEFTSALHKLEMKLDSGAAAAEFDKMDSNDGGLVLFDEFCVW
jgi:hypothetical protein